MLYFADIKKQGFNTELHWGNYNTAKIENAAAFKIRVYVYIYKYKHKLE